MESAALISSQYTGSVGTTAHKEVYSWWVHQGKECPKKEQKEPRIRMYNINNRSDISSLRLECTECGAVRNMATIFSDGAFSEYKCTCKYPHFIDPFARAEFGCDMKVTAMPRSKSGVYFPITRSALLIPPWSRNLVNYIQKNHDLLRDIPEERLADAIRRRLNDPSLIAEDIMRAWKAVNHSVGSRKQRTEDNVMRDEYDVLSGTQSVSDERFSSYRAEVPNEYNDLIDIVSVIDRLTVTQAMTGFSRKLRNESFKAPLSQYVKNWLPAVELTGEGIFIRLNQQKVYEWAERNAKRYDRMKKRMTDNGLSFERFSPVYVLLHTFAHLFIREISNHCGYSTASIREKIYSGVKDNKYYTDMCGILIYVSSADSDSSLGGLISIADDSQRLGTILTNMLERAEWCSGDPLCITSMQQDIRI